jgi:hypothetical protein
MVSLNRILKVIKERGGFIIETDLRWLKHHCPDRKVLVRRNLDRFLCTVSELEGRLKAEENNHVRDVSLPSTDSIWA